MFRIVITYTEYQNGRFSNMMKTLVIKVDNGVTFILTENSSYKGLCGSVLV